MSSRESRTLSVLPGDWDRWKDRAWALRLSVSEYLRRAEEAYNGGIVTGTSGDDAERTQAHARPFGARGIAESYLAREEGVAQYAETDERAGAADRGSCGDVPREDLEAEVVSVGTAKREAKSPSTSESDPAALPQHAPALFARPRPFSKERQTGGRKKPRAKHPKLLKQDCER